MGERSGLGPVEAALLDAMERVDARPGAATVRTQLVLEVAEQLGGIAPKLAYQMVCALAKPEMVLLPLVDFRGNAGDGELPPAAPRYTECGLTALGLDAWHADRGNGPALPIGLINGSMFLDGLRPSFAAPRVVEALLAAAAGAEDDEVHDLLGSPVFPSGCLVDGDVEALHRGERIQLQLRARIVIEAPDRVAITSLPPGASRGAAAAALLQRAQYQRLPHLSVNDQTPFGGPTRLVLELHEGSASDVVEAIGDVWGLASTRPAQMPAPLAPFMRDWVNRFATDDLAAQLAHLHDDQIGR